MCGRRPSARSRAAFSAELVAAIDGRAGQLGELHAAHPDPARGAEDQHLLARRDTAVGHHHAPRRAVGAGQRGGLVEADAVGDRDQLVRAQPAIFGEAAMHGLAGQPALDPVDRVAQHAVADLSSPRRPGPSAAISPATSSPMIAGIGIRIPGMPRRVNTSW